MLETKFGPRDAIVPDEMCGMRSRGFINSSDRTYVKFLEHGMRPTTIGVQVLSERNICLAFSMLILIGGFRNRDGFRERAGMKHWCTG